MSLLAQFFAYLMFYVSRLLLSVGKESFEEYIARKKQEDINKKNLERYKEAIKKGMSDEEVLKRESDLLNGVITK